MMSAQADLSRGVGQRNAGLPDGWEWKTLGDVSRTTSGGTPSRKVAEYFNGDIPWVKSGELPNGNVTRIAEYITDEAVKNSSAKLFPAGTLLIALYGATVGKLGILTQDATTNQAVCAIFPHDGLDTMYLFWYLRYAKSELIGQAVGGAQPNISQGILRHLQIPIAPYEQQRRIVAEIEKQFSRLDEADSNLKRVKANLKHYKAAVLRAAVEGKLTEEWRKTHPDVEPACTLLDRILAERRAKWEETELAKAAAKDKAPRNDKWKAKYKEFAAPNTIDLPILPDGWIWTTLESFLSGIETGKSFKCEERPPREGEVGVVKVSAVTWGEFDDTESKTCLDDSLINKNLLVGTGDFLFSRANTIELVGACVIAKGVLRNVMLSDKILRFKLICGLDEWTLYFLRSVHGRAEIERLATGNQESMRNIGQERIRAIRIPLPPITERDRIITEVDRHLSFIREVETQIDTNLKRAERLRQSVLTEAFSSRLRGTS